MRRRRRLAVIAALAVAGLSLGVPTALGDAQETAVLRDQYGSSTVTIDQGQSVTFVNNDIDPHNVTANGSGSDGGPLFRSDTISTGQSAAVSGTQYLTTGSYPFYCSIHTFMKGTLVVTSNGTPVPRPGGSSSSSSPSSSAGPAPAVVAPTPTKKHPKRHKRKRKRKRRRSHRRTRHKKRS